MNKRKKSRKLLLIATALTIAALVSVMYAYAAYLIGTFPGGAVTVGGVGSSTITYSSGGTWATTLQVSSVSTPWYARLEISSANTYKGPVTIAWQLYNETGSPVGSPVPTSVTLNGGAQIVYASADGATTGETNWASLISNAGTYTVTATVDSA
jgi:hypothetical protein